MSWSIDFVDYSDLTNVAHTITDFNFDLDPKTITGPDYFKQEKRFGTFTFFSDTWTDTNIISFINGTANYIPDSNYCSFAIRLQYNSANEYIGYISRNMVSYDEEFGELTIKTIDTLGLIFEIARERNYASGTPSIYGNPTGILIGELEDIISNQGNAFDISITDNSNLIEGISATQFQLYSKYKDTELASVLNSYTGGIDDFRWNALTSEEGYPELGETKTPKNVTAIYEYNGNLSVLLMKWVCNLVDNGSGNATLNETLLVRCFDITENIVIRNNLFFAKSESLSGEFVWIDEFMRTGVAYSGETDFWNLWYEYISAGAASAGHPSPIKDGIGLQLVDVVSYTSGDDYYYINQEGDYIFYTGVAQIENANVKRDEDITYKQVIDYLLLLNNLFIEATTDGNIIIKNRTTTPSSFITISDSDISKQTSSGIVKSNPDYTSICSVAYYSQESIANFLNFIYKVLFSSLKANDYFEIVAEDYIGTLLLANGITVDGQNYKINSIKLDNDRFIYQIKAWRI